MQTRGLSAGAQSRLGIRDRSGRNTPRDYFLRWRIFARIRRFFRPIFRRPLPLFFTPTRFASRVSLPSEKNHAHVRPMRCRSVGLHRIGPPIITDHREVVRCGPRAGTPDRVGQFIPDFGRRCVQPTGPQTNRSANDEIPRIRLGRTRSTERQFRSLYTSVPTSLIMATGQLALVTMARITRVPGWSCRTWKRNVSRWFFDISPIGAKLRREPLAW